jgi:MFS family permease
MAANEHSASSLAWRAVLTIASPCLYVHLVVIFPGVRALFSSVRYQSYGTAEMGLHRGGSALPLTAGKPRHREPFDLHSMHLHPPAASKYEEIRRGWKPLIACSVGTGLGLSPIPAYTSGIFATALQHQFGWPRGEILFGIVFVTAALVILGSSVGRLIDRVGPRKVAIISTLGLSVSLAMLAATSSNIWTFYAGWIFMALVSLGTLPMTYAKVISGWFDHARGLALGITLASSGVSGAFFPFYLGTLIRVYGWRVAYLGLAALPFFVAVPILYCWLKEPPAVDRVTIQPVLYGFAVRHTLGMYRFWASAAAALAIGAATSGVMINLLPLLTDKGLTISTATRALSMLAVSVTIGRLLSGYLLDRLWAPLVGVILLVPATVAVITLTLPHIGLLASIAAIAGVGLIAGTEFDLMAYMISRYFGQKHYSELFGIQYSILGLGSGTAPSIYGAIRDHAGSYRPALLVSAALLVAAAALFLTLGRYPIPFIDKEA